MNDKNEEVISDLFGILDCHEHYYEARDEVLAFLINSLTAERAKNPGVWDGAPDDATKCRVEFYSPKYAKYTKGNEYTRELQKTRAREIAEKWEKRWHKVDGKSYADNIEAAILEYAEEIK